MYDLDIADFISHNNINSIIYFSNKPTLSIKHNNLIVISDSINNFKGMKLKKVNKNILKYISGSSIICIDLDTTVTFEYINYLINNLIHLFELLHKHNLALNFNYNNSNVVAMLSFNSDVKYFNDICTSFSALVAQNKLEQYEIIYDAVCQYLDNEFSSKNLCDFCDNVCIAARNVMTYHKVNGCCYTYNYGPGGILISRPPCKYLVNSHCVADCISCKLHTCNYLTLQNIQFKIKDILLLNCFFSHKQHLVIKYNVFKTRQEILDKLIHIKHIPLIFLCIFGLYKIN